VKITPCNKNRVKTRQEHEAEEKIKRKKEIRTGQGENNDKEKGGMEEG
jgi:DNA anti-recombination protein RmuC